MDPDDERHGTYAGAMAHQRARVPACEPCKAAQREYMKSYRDARPGQRESDRQYNAARRHALEALARSHQAEFFQLLEEMRSA